MANKQRICSIPDCNKPHYGRGWCEMHYTRWRKNGDPFKAKTVRPRGQALEWLHRVAIPFKGNECLSWPFLVTSNGHGRISLNGKMVVVSRLICELTHGSSSDGRRLHAAHSCGNSACVNPRHIRWATAQENEADKMGHGTSAHGEGSSFAKLTEAEVRMIRRDYSAGRSQRYLAEQFNVSVPTISEIVNRKTWRLI